MVLFGGACRPLYRAKRGGADEISLALAASKRDLPATPGKDEQQLKISDMAERQILKAQAEGQFDKLRGAGRPLDMAGDGSVDAVGFRIMAESGALPREIELRKAVEAQRKLVQAAPDEAARKSAMKTLIDLQLRQDIEQEARRRFHGS